MTPEQIRQLVQDAYDYPFERRIAALLHLEGVTVIQAQRMALPTSVVSALHDIVFEKIKLTPRLEELARQLAPSEVYIIQVTGKDSVTLDTIIQRHSTAFTRLEAAEAEKDAFLESVFQVFDQRSGVDVRIIKLEVK